MNQKWVTLHFSGSTCWYRDSFIFKFQEILCCVVFFKLIAENWAQSVLMDVLDAYVIAFLEEKLGTTFSRNPQVGWRVIASEKPSCISWGLMASKYLHFLLKQGAEHSDGLLESGRLGSFFGDTHKHPAPGQQPSGLGTGQRFVVDKGTVP